MWGISTNKHVEALWKDSRENSKGAIGAIFGIQKNIQVSV